MVGEEHSKMKSPKIVRRLAFMAGYVPVDEAMEKMQRLVESFAESQSRNAEQSRLINELKAQSENQMALIDTLNNELMRARSPGLLDRLRQ
jgi:hypothetical protein